MCGICGVITEHGAPGDREINIVEAMKKQIFHRGPDDHGTYAGDFAVLGHRRLSIIDVEHGHQPMLSHDRRYVLVFNGEIYNYRELRSRLKREGREFGTESDTEVLLNMLIVYGERAMQYLNGMFAFFFLDTHTGEWLLCRDQFGIKPVYFSTVVPGQLVFASEIKALLVHPEIRPRVNDKGLDQYFTFQFCLDEETLFEGINKVEAGHYIKGRQSEISGAVRYWDADFTVDEHHTESYFIDTLKDLLDDSARLQIRSDVPLGAYLSGGLDSSTVSCMASKHVDGPLPVFTGKFLESPDFDESGYAHEVNDQIGGVMHEVVPTAQDFVDHLPGIVAVMDEPLAGPGVFPQYMVSQAASSEIKVILGGQGGDEIFGGYARYLVGYLEQALKGAIYETQEEGKYLVDLASIIPNMPLLKQYVPLLDNFWKKGLFEDMDSRYFHLIDRSPNLKSMLTEDAYSRIDREQVFESFSQQFNHPDTLSYINKMTHFDFKTLLPALLHVEDRVSMAASIESRVPILDTRIMELVASAPPAMKFKGGRTKSLLKKAVRGRIPERVLTRKDKMGFPVPLNIWMKGGVVNEFVSDTLLSAASRQRGLYRPDALADIAQSQGVGSRQLWGALNLELWFQTYIDGNPDSGLA